jgi:hypothetical protein
MASSGLRAAVKSAPDAVQAAISRLRNSLGNVKYSPSKIGNGVQQGITSGLKGDPAVVAKSFDDAGDAVTGLDGATAKPLGETVTGFPVTYTKGGPPPGKDPTTEMPDGPPKVNARWEQVRPYLKGTTLLAAVGVGTWLAVAGVFLQNTDGVEVKITKIEKIKDQQKQYKFTYTTQGGQMCGTPRSPCIQSAFKPCKGDTFTFRSTHTTPTLDDVTALVIEVDEDAVSFELDLTNIGNGTPEWGFMTCHNSFRNQFRASIRDAIQLVADTAKDIASPVLEGICDVIPIPFICPDAFNMGNWVLWVCIICCLLLFGIGLIAAFS